MEHERTLLEYLGDLEEFSRDRDTTLGFLVELGKGAETAETPQEGEKFTYMATIAVSIFLAPILEGIYFTEDKTERKKACEIIEKIRSNLSKSSFIGITDSYFGERICIDPILLALEGVVAEILEDEDRFRAESIRRVLSKVSELHAFKLVVTGIAKALSDGEVPILVRERPTARSFPN